MDVKLYLDARDAYSGGVMDDSLGEQSPARGLADEGASSRGRVVWSLVEVGGIDEAEENMEIESFADRRRGG